MSLFDEIHPSLEITKETYTRFSVLQYMAFSMYRVMELRDGEIIGLRHYNFLGFIWLWGDRYIEFSDFPKIFLRLGRNSDVLRTNGLRIRFQREEIYGNIILAFFAQNFFLWACVINNNFVWNLLFEGR